MIDEGYYGFLPGAAAYVTMEQRKQEQRRSQNMKAKLSIIFICMLLLYGCSKMPDHYPFPNSLETVQSVELIRNWNTDGVGIDENNFEILCVLDEMAARDF